MFQNKFTSHLLFHKSEQGGIFFLIVLVLVLLAVYRWVDFETDTVYDSTSAEIVALQNEIDSLRQVDLASREPKLYPFNPNFITDYKAYALGMSTEEYDRLQAFRKQDKWINSKADFKRVVMVSDSWLDSMAPYFKFPEWVTNPRPKTNRTYVDFNKEKKFSEKIDLNTATAVQLQEVPGIGKVLSERIVKYRDKLGGFTDDVQLFEVYGLAPEVVQRASHRFTVKSPKEILKININTATASDLAILPGMSFELAKEIWEFVRLREGITDLSELEKIESISANKLRRIQLYLSVQ